METKGNAGTDAFTLENLDKMEILTVIDIYIAGLRSGRVDLLKKTFHENAIMYGFSAEGKIQEGSVQHLYDVIE